ncbi:prophage tail gpP-like protein [Sphingomonas vulcanisoli]|uniref:Prophage tail gpP-like protein n=1 Tax=Sphingomonas vulcanisoli TaxID=1658060 RepID=A0ABX0TR83_9SPHN|nr:contractile injection system protein, VgrG/Pvc8 family [Sphingomonas vulcanisoli]NIJ07244.1 prophage tail gpP-like protein [Sphingomonas vulcanisoli]
MTDDLTLTANGRTLSGWEDISVRLLAEGFPPSFDINLSSRDPATGASEIVRPGDACQVALGGDTVITGYIDRVAVSVGPEAHVIRVQGRGKTQDLVDCAAEWPGGQISGANALEIATKLASAYGVNVVMAAGADPGPQVPQFLLTYGETGADIIQRVCRAAGLLAYEDGKGRLVLGRVGASTAASGIVYGGNAEAATVQLSMDQRYSEYVCALLSQDLLLDIGGAGFFFDTETDSGVPRHRRMYLVMEQVATDPQAFTISKARWERSRRQGRGTTVSATVDSWRDKAGALWMPNTLAPVALPGLPDGSSPLCISEVSFRRGEDGTHADLLLLPPTAFTPEPLVLQPVNLSDIAPSP